jgi:hypothetical protein
VGRGKSLNKFKSFSFPAQIFSINPFSLGMIRQVTVWSFQKRADFARNRPNRIIMDAKRIIMIQ